MSFHRFLMIPTVPVEWNPDQLKQALSDNLPEYFDMYKTVKILCDGDKGNNYAVIGGVYAEIFSLNHAASEVKILGKTLEFAPDDGEARNDDGKKQVTVSSEEEIKEFLPSNFHMKEHKIVIPMPFKCHERFNLDTIPSCVFENKIGYCSEYMPFEVFGAEKESSEPDECVVLKFGSVLDTIQALFRWNNDTHVRPVQPIKSIKIQMCDTEKVWKCKLNYRGGLGAGPCFADFKALQFEHQFVPFQEIDESVMDLNFFQAIPSSCFHCNKSFQLLGFDKNLGWVAAKCSCSYEASDNTRPTASALKGESFTRLVLSQDSIGNLEWIPLSSK